MVVDEGEWLTSSSGRFACGKETGVRRTRGWVGSGGSLDVLENRQNLLTLPVFEPRTVQPIAWSLYRLRFSHTPIGNIKFRPRSHILLK